MAVTGRPEWLYFISAGSKLNFEQRYYLDWIFTAEKSAAIARELVVYDATCQGFTRSFRGLHVKLEVFSVTTNAVCLTMLAAFTTMLYAFQEIELQFTFGQGRVKEIQYPLGKVTVWVDGGKLPGGVASMPATQQMATS